MAEGGTGEGTRPLGVICPACRASLPSDAWRDGPTPVVCGGCGARWPSRDGFRRLIDDRQVAGNDRLLRPFYEHLAPLHDPAVRYTLPLFGSGTEGNFRRGYLPRLELEALRPPADGGPVRILEVGIGSGANLPLVRRCLPTGLPVEIWGIDLAVGMLRLCRRRAAKLGERDVRLLVADAHALPFPAASFDRVFHVGATNSFREPERALAEMARVAKPGTPIVVVDERLDPGRRHSLVHRAIFRAICFYDPYPRPPTELLPPDAYDVLDEQIARFLYSLRFRSPG